MKRNNEIVCGQTGHEDIKGSFVKVMLDPFFFQSDLRCLNVPSFMNNNSQDENHLRPLSAK